MASTLEQINSSLDSIKTKDGFWKFHIAALAELKNLFKSYSIYNTKDLWFYGVNMNNGNLYIIIMDAEKPFEIFPELKDSMINIFVNNLKNVDS